MCIYVHIFNIFCARNFAGIVENIREVEPISEFKLLALYLTSI